MLLIKEMTQGQGPRGQPGARRGTWFCPSGSSAGRNNINMAYCKE